MKKNITSKLKYLVFLSVLLVTGAPTLSAADSLEASVKQQQGEAAVKEAKTNLKYLLGNVLQKSKALQDAYGDFSPYGAALFRDGSVKYVWYAKPGEVAKNSDKIIPLVWKTLNSQVNTGQIAGVAVVYKFQKPNNSQKYLGVELEYQTGFAESFAAEILNGPDNTLEWGGSNSVRAEPKLFTLKETEAPEKVM